VELKQPPEKPTSPFDSAPPPTSCLQGALRHGIANLLLHTTFSIIAGSRTKTHQRIGTKSITVHKSLFGTFEQQPLFFDNATKLHLETDDFYKATVDQLRYLLTAPKKVVEITVCMQTLEDKRGDGFYAAITRIVERMRRNVDHQMRVRKETKAEHRSHHAAMVILN
jgi:hypothetical protein